MRLDNHYCFGKSADILMTDKNGEQGRLRKPYLVAPDNRVPGAFVKNLYSYLPVTLAVIEAITSDAILNWASRSEIPWRRAIQAKSV